MPETYTPGKNTPEQKNSIEASSQENRWKKKLRNVGRTINDYNGVIFLTTAETAIATKVGSAHGSLAEAAVAGAIPIIANSVGVGAVYLYERRQERKQRKEQLRKNKPEHENHK